MTQTKYLLLISILVTASLAKSGEEDPWEECHFAVFFQKIEGPLLEIKLHRLPENTIYMKTLNKDFIFDTLEEDEKEYLKNNESAKVFDTIGLEDYTKIFLKVTSRQPDYFKLQVKEIQDEQMGVIGFNAGSHLKSEKFYSQILLIADGESLEINFVIFDDKITFFFTHIMKTENTLSILFHPLLNVDETDPVQLDLTINNETVELVLGKEEQVENQNSDNIVEVSPQNKKVKDLLDTFQADRKNNVKRMWFSFEIENDINPSSDLIFNYGSFYHSNSYEYINEGSFKDTIDFDGLKYFSKFQTLTLVDEKQNKSLDFFWDFNKFTNTLSLIFHPKNNELSKIYNISNQDNLLNFQINNVYNPTEKLTECSLDKSDAKFIDLKKKSSKIKFQLNFKGKNSDSSEDAPEFAYNKVDSFEIFPKDFDLLTYQTLSLIQGIFKSKTSKYFCDIDYFANNTDMVIDIDYRMERIIKKKKII